VFVNALAHAGGRAARDHHTGCGSGRGPGKGVLADTGWGQGGGHRELQMLEELPDHLAVRDGGDAPQRPLLTARAARHVQGKHPLQQPRPVPLETGKAGVMLVAPWTALLTTCAWRSPAGRARRALRFERLSWTCTPAGAPWFTSCRKLRHERPYRAEQRPWEPPRLRRRVG
jgi:hypothetical protein